MEGSLFYQPTTLEDGYLQQTLNRLLHLTLRTIQNLNLDPLRLCPMKSPVLETGVILLTNLLIVERNMQQLSHFTYFMIKIGLDLVDLPLFKIPTLEVKL